MIELEIGDYDVKIERKLHTNIMHITYNEKKQKDVFFVKMSINPTSVQIIDGKKIENFSDFLFHLMKIEPPYVWKNKQDYDSDLIRLSFRDIFNYSYMEQDDMDSSLFNLERTENSYMKAKSRDALRFILGYKIGKMSELEHELFESRQQKKGFENSKKELEKFLVKNDVKNYDDILLEEDRLKNKLKELEHETNSIRNKKGEKKNNILDELKIKSNELSIQITKINQRIIEYEYRIKEQNE